MRSKPLIIAASIAVWATFALAQGTAVALSGLSVDPKQPVEMTSDALTVDQATGAAVFEGNVTISQGALRLTADAVSVIYSADTGEIAHLQATGSVAFKTDAETIEAKSADYDLLAGLLVLEGDVRMTQGVTVITAGKMTVDITHSSARLEGGVRTVLQGVGN